MERLVKKTSQELVLFDKNNKEIDWYDPVNPDEIKEDDDSITVSVGGTDYKLLKKDFDHYVVREMAEEVEEKKSWLIEAKITLKIVKNEEGEYEVQYLEDGVKNEAKTYYTDDKEDAEMTKKKMEEELKKKSQSIESVLYEKERLQIQKRMVSLTKKYKTLSEDQQQKMRDITNTIMQIGITEEDLKECNDMLDKIEKELGTKASKESKVNFLVSDVDETYKMKGPDLKTPWVIAAEDEIKIGDKIQTELYVDNAWHVFKGVIVNIIDDKVEVQWDDPAANRQYKIIRKDRVWKIGSKQAAMIYKGKGWDGTVIFAANKKELIDKIKEYLNKWIDEGYEISWDWDKGTVTVIDSAGKATDKTVSFMEHEASLKAGLLQRCDNCGKVVDLKISRKNGDVYGTCPECGTKQYVTTVGKGYPAFADKEDSKMSWLKREAYEQFNKGDRLIFTQDYTMTAGDSVIVFNKGDIITVGDLADGSVKFSYKTQELVMPYKQLKHLRKIEEEAPIEKEETVIDDDRNVMDDGKTVIDDGETVISEEADNDEEEITKEQVMEILNDVKKRLSTLAREWGFRDTIKEFSDWGFYKGPAMASVDIEAAKDIFNALYEAVDEGVISQLDDLAQIYDEIGFYASHSSRLENEATKLKKGDKVRVFDSKGKTITVDGDGEVTEVKVDQVRVKYKKGNKEYNHYFDLSQVEKKAFMQKNVFKETYFHSAWELGKQFIKEHKGEIKDLKGSVKEWLDSKNIQGTGVDMDELMDELIKFYGDKVKPEITDFEDTKSWLIESDYEKAKEELLQTVEEDIKAGKSDEEIVKELYWIEENYLGGVIKSMRERVKESDLESEADEEEFKEGDKVTINPGFSAWDIDDEDVVYEEYTIEHINKTGREIEYGVTIKLKDPDGKIEKVLVYFMENELTKSKSKKKSDLENEAKKPKMTEEAREFISKKIKILMEEGMEQDQAIAVAHEMARKKGYDVPEAPKEKKSWLVESVFTGQDKASLLKKGKSIVDKIKKSVGDILETDDLLRYIGDGIADKISAHGKDTFEVDVRMGKIDMPKGAEGKLSDDVLNDIFWTHVNDVAELIGDDLVKRYEWIKDWSQEGRSGGWFVLHTDFGSLEGYLDEVKDYIERLQIDIDSLEKVKDDDENERGDLLASITEYNNIKDEVKALKRISVIQSELETAVERINTGRKNLEKELSSMDFWKEYIEEEKKSSLEKQAGTEIWKIPDEDKYWLLSTVTMKKVGPIFDDYNEAVDYAVEKKRWDADVVETMKKEKLIDGEGYPEEKRMGWLSQDADIIVIHDQENSRNLIVDTDKGGCQYMENIKEVKFDEEGNVIEQDEKKSQLIEADKDFEYANAVPKEKSYEIEKKLFEEFVKDKKLNEDQTNFLAGHLDSYYNVHSLEDKYHGKKYFEEGYDGNDKIEKDLFNDYNVASQYTEDYWDIVYKAFVEEGKKISKEKESQLAEDETIASLEEFLKLAKDEDTEKYKDVMTEMSKYYEGMEIVRLDMHEAKQRGNTGTITVRIPAMQADRRDNFTIDEDEKITFSFWYPEKERTMLENYIKKNANKEPYKGWLIAKKNDIDKESQKSLNWYTMRFDDIAVARDAYAIIKEVDPTMLFSEPFQDKDANAYLLFKSWRDANAAKDVLDEKGMKKINVIKANQVFNRQAGDIKVVLVSDHPLSEDELKDIEKNVLGLENVKDLDIKLREEKESDLEGFKSGDEVITMGVVEDATGLKRDPGSKATVTKVLGPDKVIIKFVGTNIEVEVGSKQIRKASLNATNNQQWLSSEMETEATFSEPAIEKILEKIETTTEAELKDKLFGEDEYIDTPGFWKEEKDDYEDIREYMLQNMGEKEYDKLISWLQLHMTKVSDFMGWSEKEKKSDLETEAQEDTGNLGDIGNGWHIWWEVRKSEVGKLYDAEVVVDIGGEALTDEYNEFEEFDTLDEASKWAKDRAEELKKEWLKKPGPKEKKSDAEAKEEKIKVGDTVEQTHKGWVGKVLEVVYPDEEQRSNNYVVEWHIGKIKRTRMAAGDDIKKVSEDRIKSAKTPAGMYLATAEDIKEELENWGVSDALFYEAMENPGKEFSIGGDPSVGAAPTDIMYQDGEWYWNIVPEKKSWLKEAAVVKTPKQLKKFIKNLEEEVQMDLLKLYKSKGAKGLAKRLKEDYEATIKLTEEELVETINKLGIEVILEGSRK